MDNIERNISEIQDLKSILIRRKEGVSPFNMPEIANDPKIKDYFLSIATHFPDESITFLKDLEKKLKRKAEKEKRRKDPATALSGYKPEDDKDDD
jgi:hypothetical protein